MVLNLLTAMTLKRMRESISFESNWFIACKIKDETKVAKSLIVFNLLKIIHPFQAKKHLRTYWNLSCNPQEYVNAFL